MSSFYHRVLKQSESIGAAAALSPAPDYNALVTELLISGACTTAGCDWALTNGLVSAVPSPPGSGREKKA